MTTTAVTPSPDERLRREHHWKRLLRRPELGALGGAILVWIVFALLAGNKGFVSLGGTANYLSVAADVGILGVAVSLLMIAGEFDLSIGSMIGATGMITCVLSVHYQWNIWLALVTSLVAALIIGAINGVVVVRTRLHSFIITLASQFILRGVVLGLTRLITGLTIVGGLTRVPGYDGAALLFANALHIQSPGAKAGVVVDFPVSILWWLGFAVIASYVLLQTRPGNWIYGIGGDINAARNMGVPVNRMKILLFMLTAFAAWLVASIQVLTYGSADVLRGQGQEFYAIITVVIGGTLLTGGYGSAIGAVFGALIFGMVNQGIFFAGIDSDWFYAFLGTMLIVAVLVNNFIRKRASETR